MRKLVQHVGINDAGYQVKIFESYIEDGKRKKKEVWVCPFYQRWRDMLKRCYSPKYHISSPSCVGSSVDERWHRFSVFKEWMEQQDWEGMVLDKDILVSGNRVYGPDTCAFIPHPLNTVLIAHQSKRGSHPLGVYRFKDKRLNPYQAYISAKGKLSHLGYYSSPEEAHAMWQRAKIQTIKGVMAGWENPNSRVVTAIGRVIAKLQSDLDNGRETISFAV